ncbi:hypothetical protein [Rhizobium sp. BK491]|uniref:hypothetical protein n=1 Tax=Rhizobium sp. BK491 TaxID=2587009 RepID=UPI00160B9666|nr:hypothetical protein [Rhizobium sp. BK491]MBB3571862.1 hypothetical protein [Rhizobium sp. BK491]
MNSNLFLNSILRRIVSGSLILAISGYAAGSIPIAAMIYVAQAAFASPAGAAPNAKRNARGLLSDMRASLGMIAKSYKEASGPRHRSTASVLEAVALATRATERLEAALATPNSRAIADATGNLSKAIGELQTRYALTVSQNSQAAQGMRYLNAAWKSYCSGYILSKPANETRAVSKAEIRALRERVNLLEKRVASLEDQVANNATLRREVVRLRHDLSYYNDRPDDYWTYQSMLLTLTVVSGSFDAFSYTARTYYPTYYVYFEPIVPEFEVWHSYWDGYYDGYYADRNSLWYDEPTIIDDPLVEINQIEVNQDITYQTIYNITNETRVEYEALPRESLAEIDIPATPDNAVFTVQELQQPEHGSSAAEMRETAPVNANLNDDISKPHEAIEPRNDKASDVHILEGDAKLPDSAEGRRDSTEVEVVPGDELDNVHTRSKDEPQKRDISSEEKDNDLDQVGKDDGNPQQQIDQSVDTKGPANVDTHQERGKRPNSADENVNPANDQDNGVAQSEDGPQKRDVSSEEKDDDHDHDQVGKDDGNPQQQIDQPVDANRPVNVDMHREHMKLPNGADEDAISVNDRDNGAAQSVDVPQKRDVSSEENDDGSDQAGKSGRAPGGR